MRNEERDLARTLHDRAHDVGGHPIGLDMVKSSARRIQRRRRIGGTVAAVAVVAVAVPFGMNAFGGTDQALPPATQSTPTVTPSKAPTKAPSASPSATPTQAAAPDQGTALVLASVKDGAAPNVSWLEGRTWHHGGSTDTLPAAYDDVAPYHGGLLGYFRSGGEGKIARLDTTFAVTSTRPGGDIVTTDDGVQLGWVEDGALHSGLGSGMSDSEPTQALPAGASATAVGFLRGGDLVYSLDGTSPSVHRTDLNGKDVVVPGLLKSWGVSQAGNLVGGETKVNADGTSCWAVTKPTGEVVWHTCDFALGSFSPDGKYVVGTPSQGDGLGSPYVALLDVASGKVVARFHAPTGSQLYLRGFAWEDGTHLLASAHEGSTWSVLRMGTDGHVDRALPAKPGSPTDPPYRLTH